MIEPTGAPPPEFPPDTARLEASSLVDFYASSAVRNHWGKFIEALGRFQYHADNITRFQSYRGTHFEAPEGLGDLEVEAWRQLPELREELIERVTVLAGEMRSDAL